SIMSSNASEGSFYFDLSGPFVNRFLRIGYFRMIIDFLANSLMLVIMGTVAWKCIRLKLLRTANHAVYSTLGLFFFVAWSQMLTCHSCWLAKSFWAYILHAVLGALAMWTGGMGILAKILDKRRENKKFNINDREGHMSSKHSRCGLVGFLFLLFCVLTGVVLFGVHRAKLQLCHRTFGLFSFGCLASSQWFSFSTVFARREWNWLWIRGLQLSTAIATVLVGYEEL
ncbi:hypothetical protein KR200_008321, partial [Drosophila serrata]